MPYPPKRFVYVIRSVSDPARRYVGVTADPAARLSAHNAGGNRSTARWRPWFMDVCVEFRTEAVAIRFERYLKTGSGRAFALRHFSPTDTQVDAAADATVHEERSVADSGCV